MSKEQKPSERIHNIAHLNMDYTPLITTEYVPHVLTAIIKYLDEQAEKAAKEEIRIKSDPYKYYNTTVSSDGKGTLDGVKQGESEVERDEEREMNQSMKENAEQLES